jgi:hypothetical protein
MHEFRTVLPAQQAPFQISHQDKLLLVGSCFTEHIGARLAARKFQTSINPFGIVYNPVSIARCLERLSVGNKPFVEEDLVENGGLWHSWEHHSRFSAPDQAQTLAGINVAYRQAAQQLNSANRLLLTLGTAAVFTLLTSGQVVANNHKIPASAFHSKQLSVGEVTETLGAILAKMTATNPNLQIILSVSPLRHLRNGMVENQRSKAVLLLACADLCRQLPNTHYFPAYELLLDDLRDYRFYAADMIHPTDVAVDYIWEYFSKMFFSKETDVLITAIEKILAGAQHRPFHPDTEQHKDFLAAQSKAIAALKKILPW